MNQPRLMPEPNNLRFARGFSALSACGCAGISAGALAACPGVLEALNKGLGSALRPARGDETPGLSIKLLGDEELETAGSLFPGLAGRDLPKEEAYFLRAGGGEIVLAAGDARGFFHAEQTLRQLCVGFEDGLITIKNCVVFDYPHLPLRGSHIYLPAREHIGFCKRYLEELARLKYNTVYFEVSAMEYRRHPEINEAWLEYARDMGEYPEKAKAFQNGSHGPEHPWYKNSIHIENGGGGVLSQEEVRGIVLFAKALGLDVVPEVQSLSHCDYLVIPHREIAEHPDDPYPDAYCPSDPRSYELLFDVIDEVLEVFAPKSVHIGHDEWYSAAMCPRCRGRDAAELLAGDVSRIYGYLKGKGVAVEMAADKLLDAHTPDSRGQGGACRIVEDYETSEIYNRMPATHRALEMIPKDIVLQNWYWALEPLAHRHFADHGFNTSYQNFGAFGSLPKDWAGYSGEPGVLGGVLTHWDLVDERTMAWDMYLTETVLCAQLLWNEHVSDEGLGPARDLAFAEMPRCRQALSGQTLPSLAFGAKETVPVHLRHEKKERFYMDSSCVELRNFFDTVITEAPQGKYFRGVAVERKETAQSFRIALPCGRADSLVFRHCTDIPLPYRSADSGVRAEDYLIGFYTAGYCDGTSARIDLEYGFNIGSRDAEWGFDPSGSDGAFACDVHLCQTAYAARPSVIVTNGRDRSTVYAYEWVNPEPDKEISEISLTLLNKHVPYGVFVYGIDAVRLAAGRAAGRQ